MIRTFVLATALGAVLGTLAVSSEPSGAPLGTALAVYRFRGRGALIVIANALLGLPPVVVGLAVYLLLSRSGPLGSECQGLCRNWSGDGDDASGDDQYGGGATDVRSADRA